MSGRIAKAAAQGDAVDVDAILNDPEAPVGSNPNGDVTIVAFIDDNCPFCKKSDPDLRRLAAADGKIKLIYKDLPILAETSVYRTRMRSPQNIRENMRRLRQRSLPFMERHRPR